MHSPEFANLSDTMLKFVINDAHRSIVYNEDGQVLKGLESAAEHKEGDTVCVYVWVAVPSEYWVGEISWKFPCDQQYNKKSNNNNKF